jgi:hypothetical protein
LIGTKRHVIRLSPTRGHDASRAARPGLHLGL